MTVRIVRNWLADIGAKTLCIELGNLWENGYCESFNGKLRGEKWRDLLNLKEAKVVIL